MAQAVLADRKAIEVELKSYLQTMQVDGETDTLDWWQLIFQGWQDWPRNISVSRQVLLLKGHLALVVT